MREGVFKVRGKVVRANGAPFSEVVLAIVDEDLLNDDLIGIGVTDANGEFRLSFTTEAFNQDALECESTPDLYIVASLRFPGELVPIHKQEFSNLTFKDGVEDLGEIKIDSIEPLAGQVAIPGYKKIAKRLELDDETLSDAASEMSALVESLTGWKNLLDGVKVKVTDSIGKTFVGVLEGADGSEIHDRDHAARMLNVSFAVAGVVALYDPFARVIHVDQRSMERQNLDGLRIFLGHELVHVGQFREHPELLEEQKPILKNAVAKLRGESPTSDGSSQEEIEKRTFGLMANIEGYASHIEHDFLRKLYNCAEPLQHTSVIELITTLALGVYGSIRGDFSRPSTSTAPPVGSGSTSSDESEGGDSVSSKLNQYGAGLRAYRARAEGNKPAKFDPTLRPENTAGDELDTALLEERAKWGNVEAMYDLATRFLDAEGKEKNIERGLSLLKTAADAGHGQAQCDLGARYFSGDEVEKDLAAFVHWTTKAMAADVPRAFFNMALAHQLGDGVPKDLKRRAELLEEALKRGHKKAAVLLARALIYGQGVAKDVVRARDLLEPAVERGDAEAAYYLGNVYENGLGVDKDLTRSLELYRASAEGGEAMGAVALGAKYESGAGVKQSFTEAVAWYEKAVAGGSSLGKSCLGTLLLYGRGAPRNVDRAIVLLEEAAAAEVLAAKYNLAVALLRFDPAMGETPLKVDEGLRWLKAAAEGGLLVAQTALGRAVIRGGTVTRDVNTGLDWLRRAAKSGHTPAQYDLGFYLFDGKVVAQDLTEAAHWFTKAAEAGHVDAMTELGACYSNGEGVPKDGERELFWTQKAADAGSALALRNLGHMYASGRFVSADPSKAVALYNKAAEAGLTLAMRDLSQCLLEGKGIEADRQAAIGWLKKAAAQGDELAKKKLEEIAATT